MGCFNHKGNFSNLPIIGSDRIVVILGISLKGHSSQMDGFSPGMSFIPISLPIRGKYNDYGSIENVDKTPGVLKLEEVFNMTIEEIVDSAERIQSSCEDQIDIKKIKNVLKTILSNNGNKYESGKMELSYIMEHETIFDKIVSIGGPQIKDKYFLSIPFDILKTLGYSCTITDNTDSSRLYSQWEHESLPCIKNQFYTWVDSDFGNYSETVHTISKLCEKLKCSCPDEYNASFYKECFIQSCDDKIKLDEYRAKPENERFKSMDDELLLRIAKYLNNKSFDNWEFTYIGSTIRNGLFNLYEGFPRPSHGFMNIFNIVKNEHLDIRYADEFADMTGFMMGLHELEMTWGTTNYYRQDINYKAHIDFAETCYNFISKMKKDYGE